MSIAHLEDLPLGAFIKAVQNIGDFHASEKLDGANLWMGLDGEGKLFTSREGKSNRAKRFFSEAEYPKFAAYNGFRSAHAAMEAKVDDIKRIMQPNQMVECEILYGRQPNAVTYGADDKSYIAFLRGVDGTPDVVADQLSMSLGGTSVKVNVEIVETSDGENLDISSQDVTYQFTGAQKIDSAKLRDVKLDQHIADLEKYLAEPSGVNELSNGDLLNTSLGSIKQDQRPDAKLKKNEILAKVYTDFKLPIKKELLDNFVSKIKPQLADPDLTSDEDLGVEGVVLRDPTTGNLIKLVDKDAFTTINAFNHAIRNQISNVTKTLDPTAPLEARGGIVGDMKNKIADLLGNAELARGSTAKRAFEKVKGATPVDTVKNFAKNLEINDFLGTKRKLLALIQQAALDLRTMLNDFKEHSDEFQLKLKSGKVIGITPEIQKRTLLVFAESRRNILELFEKIKKAKTIAQVIATLYGHLAAQVHEKDSEDPPPTEMSEALLPVFESREDADDFIKGWTFDSDWHRNNHDDPTTKEGFSAAFKAYPYKKKSRLYRGLSFSSVADRDAAKKQLETGKLTDKSLSSWTPDKDQARTYALLDDEYDDGIPGFVVSMVPPTGTRMVDPSKSPRGEASEIIVDAGTYDVKLEESPPVNEALELFEKKYDTDKKRYANKDAYTIMNIYFATVFMSALMYQANDAKGIKMLKDRSHYKMTSWDKDMSPLNFWGYPVWRSSQPAVKKLIGPKAATAIFKVARRAAPSMSRYLHMDLSFGKDVPIEWKDHWKTMKVLQQFDGMNTDRINTIMDGVFRYETLSHDQQVKVVGKLFFYVNQFIPTSPLFIRLKHIQSELLHNANGENEHLVEMKLLSEINSIVEDEDPTMSGPGDQGSSMGSQTTLATRASDANPSADAGTKIQMRRRIEKRKRNPDIKRTKFPKPDDATV